MLVTQKDRTCRILIDCSIDEYAGLVAGVQAALELGAIGEPASDWLASLIVAHRIYMAGVGAPSLVPREFPSPAPRALDTDLVPLVVIGQGDTRREWPDRRKGNKIDPFPRESARDTAADAMAAAIAEEA